MAKKQKPVERVPYITGICPDVGKLLCGGLFTLKDTYGFPLDAACEECQSRNLLPDWCEYLADAGDQEQWKFDAAVKEMTLLVGEEPSKEILAKFEIVFERCPETTFRSKCHRLRTDKAGSRIAFGKTNEGQKTS